MRVLRTALPLAGVIILWGSSFLLSKLALLEVGPMALAFYRWGIGSAGLMGYLAWRGRLGEAAHLARRCPWMFARLGLVGVTLFFAFQNLALRYTTAMHVGVLINLNPVFIALLSALVLGERLSGLQWGGILSAAAGVALVCTSGEREGLGGISLLGDGLTLLSAACWAIYSVLGRRVLARHDPLVVTVIVAGWGTLWLLPLVGGEGFSSYISPKGWLVIALLGLLCSALAYLLWFQVLALMPPGRAAVYLFLIPLVSCALSVAFLHEPFTLRTGLGAALVVAGVFCTETGGKAQVI